MVTFRNNGADRLVVLPFYTWLGLDTGVCVDSTLCLKCLRGWRGSRGVVSVRFPSSGELAK